MERHGRGEAGALTRCAGRPVALYACGSARLAEPVDAADLKSDVREDVGVRVPRRAPAHRRSGGQHRHVIGADGAVGGDDHQPFALRLSHQHAIERVAMVKREVVHHREVPRFDAEQTERRLLGIEWSLDMPKPAHPMRDRDLPWGHRLNST